MVGWCGCTEPPREERGWLTANGIARGVQGRSIALGKGSNKLNLTLGGATTSSLTSESRGLCYPTAAACSPPALGHQCAGALEREVGQNVPPGTTPGTTGLLPRRLPIAGALALFCQVFLPRPLGGADGGSPVTGSAPSPTVGPSVLFLACQLFGELLAEKRYVKTVRWIEKAPAPFDLTSCSTKLRACPTSSPCAISPRSVSRSKLHSGKVP